MGLIQIKKPERGFATTSIVKKKDLEPEAVQDAIPEVVTVKDDPDDTATGTVKPGTAQASVQASWEDSPDKKAQDADQALADKVKALSEKDYNKQIKVLEYEKRVSSSYSEFFWDDPTDVVSEHHRVMLRAASAEKCSYHSGTESSSSPWKKVGKQTSCNTASPRRSCSLESHRCI